MGLGERDNVRSKYGAWEVEAGSRNLRSMQANLLALMQWIQQTVYPFLEGCSNWYKFPYRHIKRRDILTFSSFWFTILWNVSIILILSITLVLKKNFFGFFFFFLFHILNALKYIPWPWYACLHYLGDKKPRFHTCYCHPGPLRYQTQSLSHYRSNDFRCWKRCRFLLWRKATRHS